MAEARGAVVLEGVEAEGLSIRNGAVRGVRTRSANGQEIFRAPIVINATGPSSAAVAEQFDRPVPDLFRPSLAFNLLLDLPPPSEVGLAISPPVPKAPVLFLSQW